MATGKTSLGRSSGGGMLPWLGLALMSVGSVLTLKSLSMKNAG